MTSTQTNMEPMQTLDDAWNAPDLEVFAKRHKDDVVVRWPSQPPTGKSRRFLHGCALASFLRQIGLSAERRSPHPPRARVPGPAGATRARPRAGSASGRRRDHPS